MKKGTDYIGVGVGALIIKEGKLLIQKRGKKTNNQRGKWEIPGGGVEWGETFKDALKREVKEEIGVEIEVISQFGLWDEILVEEKQHWVAPTFICKIKKGTPKIMEPEKSEEIGWFTLKEADKLDLSYITRKDIDLLIEKFPQGLPLDI